MSSCIITGASHSEGDDVDVVMLFDGGGGVVDGEVVNVFAREGFAHAVVGGLEARRFCKSYQNSSP